MTGFQDFSIWSFVGPAVFRYLFAEQGLDSAISMQLERSLSLKVFALQSMCCLSSSVDKKGCLKCVWFVVGS